MLWSTGFRVRQLPTSTTRSDRVRQYNYYRFHMSHPVSVVTFSSSFSWRAVKAVTGLTVVFRVRQPFADVGFFRQNAPQQSPATVGSSKCLKGLNKEWEYNKRISINLSASKRSMRIFNRETRTPIINPGYANASMPNVCGIVPSGCRPQTRSSVRLSAALVHTYHSHLSVSPVPPPPSLTSA